MSDAWPNLTQPVVLDLASKQTLSSLVSLALTVESLYLTSSSFNNWCGCLLRVSQ